jgi:ABC-2 type transport system ATP-binding protein
VTMQPAVRVEGLTRRFGRTLALDAVTLDVRPGELFGLIGPDGAGKTTLFRTLATLIVADEGSAQVLGFDAGRDLWEIRARIGYMPGRFSLYPDLSVEENLRFFASVFGTTLEQGYPVIAPIYKQIEPFRDRRAGALSGGMKQKLALSCALVHRPELLLLDEPTTGVDAVSRREFWDLLHELRATGLTIVVATPYMDEAARCDRVALMQGGRVLAIDEPGSLGARFEHPLLAVQGADRYRLLHTLRRHPHAKSVFPFGEALHYADARRDRAAGEIRGDLQEYLSAEGFRDVQVTEIDPGIEDLFMALMGSPAAAPAA